VSGVAQKGSESMVPRKWYMVDSLRVVIVPEVSPGDATVGKEVSRYFMSRIAVSIMCWRFDMHCIFGLVTRLYELPVVTEAAKLFYTSDARTLR